MSDDVGPIILSTNKRKAIILIKKNQHVTLSGCCDVACLFGEIFIHGFYINSKNSSFKRLYPVVSYTTSLLHTVIVNRGNRKIEGDDLENVKQSLLVNFPLINEQLKKCPIFSAIIYLSDVSTPTIQMMKYYYSNCLKNFDHLKSTRLFKHLHILSNDIHAKSSILYNFEIENNILNRKNFKLYDKEPFKIITIGDKNSGKSTINRFVANSYLSQGICDVLWLDLDIGQPEFTTSGFMSLTHVKEPIFTPPPFHMKFEEGKVLFVGDFNMVSLHRRYITILQELLRKLYSVLNDNKKYIVIINTMGYITEKGKILLDEIISILQPNLFIMCSKSENLEYSNDLAVDKNTIKVLSNFNDNSIQNPGQVRQSNVIDNGKNARSMRVVGYMSNIFSSFPRTIFSPIPSLWPVHVLKMKNLLLFNEPELPYIEESKFKEAFEVTMVALCNFIDGNENGFNKVPFQDSNLPTPLIIQFRGLVMKLSYRLTNLECYGVGIITNIDMVNKTISICSPVESHIIFNKVRILARGRGLQIPSVILDGKHDYNDDGYHSLRTSNRRWGIFNLNITR
uniref:CLP1_P domain-containing protein n=1 Tax=Parastrongyloides trichosuri TaxID=131310 RepID=A0A0N4ZY77_PARTI